MVSGPLARLLTRMGSCATIWVPAGISGDASGTSGSTPASSSASFAVGAAGDASERPPSASAAPKSGTTTSVKTLPISSVGAYGGQPYLIPSRRDVHA